jgi:hypothetical protein
MPAMGWVRFLVVGWMVAWLGASGALAAVMPYCDHALGSRGPVKTGDASMAAGHHASQEAHAAHAAHDASTHHEANAGDAHAGLACDDCGSCHLLGSGIPAALMPDSAAPPGAERRASMTEAFGGHIPEQPYHPPKTAPAA